MIVRRALRAHHALGIAGPPRRPWGRIVRAPFFAGRRDVVQARDLPYAAAPRQRLDVHYRRDRPGAPVLVHFHGGGFRSGSKSREALPLIRHLVSRRGFVCVSAGYRLQPQVQLEDQVADVRAAIAWVRAQAASSARIHRCSPSRAAPPVRTWPCVPYWTASRGSAQSSDGTATTATWRRPGTCRTCCSCTEITTCLSRPTRCAPSPTESAAHPATGSRTRRSRGAHHDFDMFQSIRAAAVAAAVDQFLDEVPADG